jgi:hypothetical protein
LGEEVADDFGVGGGVVAGFEGVVRVVEEFELRGAVGGADGGEIQLLIGNRFRALRGWSKERTLPASTGWLRRSSVPDIRSIR